MLAQFSVFLCEIKELISMYSSDKYINSFCDFSDEYIAYSYLFPYLKSNLFIQMHYKLYISILIGILGYKSTLRMSLLIIRIWLARLPPACIPSDTLINAFVLI